MSMKHDDDDNHCDDADYNDNYCDDDGVGKIVEF